MKKIRTKILIEAAVVIAVALALMMSSSAVITDRETNVTNLDPIWADDFEGYTLGQVLDGDPDDGGWTGWDDDPQYGATVVDDQAHSTSQSVDVVDNTDLVQQYTGCTSGQFTYIAWQYIPNDFEGNSYFILLSHYEVPATQESCLWAVQIRFDSDNQIAECEYDTISLPLITGRWVELRTEIDLDADWFQFYYDGVLLHEKAWTATPNNDFTGVLEISAVDLYANGATSVYYDDMSLEGVVNLLPELEVTINSGFGIGVSANIKNTGEANATDVDWTIKVTGGILKLIDKTFSGTISTLGIGDEEAIKSGMILGLGKIAITVSAECAEGVSDEATGDGTQIIIFTLVS